MLAEMLATGLSYLLTTPVFSLSQGCDSTVLKGMEVTAYISANAQVSTANLLAAKANDYRTKCNAPLLTAADR